GKLPAQLGDGLFDLPRRPLAQLAPNRFDLLSQFGIVVGDDAAHVVLAQILLGERALLERVEQRTGPLLATAEHAYDFSPLIRRQLGPISQECSWYSVTLKSGECSECLALDFGSRLGRRKPQQRLDRARQPR